MQLWVGLGNPGEKYARNRHNIGFMAVDQIASDHGFAPWRGKFQGRLCEGMLGSQKVLLLKPETFMNLSGHSVGEAMRFYKLGAGDVTVFHDEIDLAPAKVRLKTGGGHAGHNGLRSVHAAIGPDYHRVRLGVGHPGRKEAVPGYVLHDFAKAEAEWLDDVIRGLADGAPDLARGDGGRFQNAIARRVAPARSSTSAAPKSKAPKSKAAQSKDPKSTKPQSEKPQSEKPQAEKAQSAKPQSAKPSSAAPKSAKPEAPTAQDPEPAKSALQRLIERFK